MTYTVELHKECDSCKGRGMVTVGNADFTVTCFDCMGRGRHLVYVEDIKPNLYNEILFKYPLDK